MGVNSQKQKSTAVRSSNPTLRRARPSAALCRCTLEALEQRQLLAAVPYISEFLASNDDGLADENGERMDWIEIANPSAGSIDLNGYYLTDDADDLNKWRLPAVTLDAGAYLVVFASGKDRAVAGSPLHTSFSLDIGGDYLGLVAPDGSTIISKYDPQFPQQVRDISYGVSTTVSATTLIGPAAPAKTFIPTNSSLESSWMLPGFNDSSWTSGKTGVGFDLDNVPVTKSGFTVRQLDVGNGISDIVQARNALNGIGSWSVVSDTTSDSLAVNHGSGGDFGNDLPYYDGSFFIDTIAIRAKANVFIPAGTWTFNVKSDDGFMLTVPGITFTNRINEDYQATGWTATTVPANTLVYSAPRGAAHTSGSFTVPTGGINTTITLDFYENGGGDLVEFSMGAGSQGFGGSFVPAGDGALPGWQIKTTSTTPPPNYNSIISTGVASQMANKNSSAYVRIPISALVTPEDFDRLRLKMKYDDGFIVYLNGVEIARRNAPASTTWNSAATATRPDTDSIIYELIDIDLPAGLLQPGANANLLAIQGLNISAADLDFLVYPELQGLRTIESKQTYFTAPTPGAANAVSNTTEVVLDTTFSHDRGFYSGPFNVAITTATLDAQIRYTLDGSTPTATTGQIYSGPIQINGTSILRAAAFKPGAISSNVDTQTYIFVSDVIQQSPDGLPPAGWPATWSPNVTDYGMDPDVVNNPLYSGQFEQSLLSIPTFSIVTDQPNLFGTTGIYSNPGWDGRTAERPASIELMYPDGTDGFQIDAGLRIRGGFSRSTDNPKHAFRVLLSDEYGQGKLEHPFFGEGVDIFDGFDLRTFQNYSWSFQGDGSGIFVRDQFSRDLQLAMGQPGSRGNYYHLYVNGQYWGLYNTDERPEANYAANQFGGDSDDYDVIKVAPDDGYTIYATDGNLAAWTELWTQALGDMSNDANYMRIQGLNPDGTRNPEYPVLLDVDNLIDYMLVIFYGGNLDAPLSNFLSNDRPNNFFAIRNRESNDQGFIFIVHDAEHTLLNVNEDRTGPYNTFDTTNPSASLPHSNPQFIFQQMAASPEFRMRVADRVHRWFYNDGPMKYENALAIFNQRIAEIDMAVIAESARWGDAKRATPLTRDAEWTNEVNRVRNQYLPSRATVVVNQLMADNLVPSLRAPIFSQFGGIISTPFSLTITRPDNVGTLYYTLDGSDPRLRGGTVSTSATVYTGSIPLAGQTTVTARIYNAATDTWTAMTQASFRHNLGALRITEIMYNPAPDAQNAYPAQDYEFVELTSFGATQLDLSGAGFTRGIDFIFPDDTRINPGQRIVLARNPLAFAQRYPGVAALVLGPYGGQLDNAGERLTLSDSIGSALLDFSYSDGWYPVTDGDGFSLVVINALADPAVYGSKSNWRASNPAGGGPGAADPGHAAGSIIINEVMTNTLNPAGDWVELHNTTHQPIDISYWFLSDDPGTPMKYQVQPGTIIPAGGYLVLMQAEHFGGSTNPGVRTLFGFSWLGDEVVLRSNDTLDTVGGYFEQVDFAAAALETPFGWYVKSTGGKDIVALSAPTMGYANALPAVGPVVISEIMYSPLGGGDEFIELYNITASPYLFHDPADPFAKWAFIDGVEYTFKPGEQIAGNGYALVVEIEPALFRSRYNIPGDVPIFGPWVGSLDNAGESLKLGRYAGTTELGVERYITLDQVNYSDKGNWPSSPNGTGPSLTRIVFSAYGNDAGNWAASPAGGTPGDNVTPPAAPSTLTGTGIGGPKIRLFWQDNSTTEDGFLIERSANGTTYTQVGSVGANTTTFEDSTGLTAGVYYTYRVRAHNALGNSAWSNLINVAAPVVQTVNLVEYTGVWRYNQSRTDLAADWMTSGYDDSVAGWSWGAGLLYVEDSWSVGNSPAPLGTVLNIGPSGDRTRTHYFRHEFTLTADPADIGSLRLWIIVDDGAVIYLNGKEVFSIGMPAGPYSYATFANRGVNNAIVEGPFLLSAADLVSGVNTLAVEVHQTNASSTDVAWGAMLQAVVTPQVVSASIAPVTPDPATAPINSMTITFDAPITGFDLSDLRLTRSGGPSLLTGQQTLSSTDGMTWTLDNLAPLTNISGQYTLSLQANASGISAGAGRILGSDAWRNFRVTSTTLDIADEGGMLYLRRNGDSIEVFTALPNGVPPLYIISIADLQSLTINGGDGNDLLQIASVLPAIPQFNGGGGIDRLDISAGQHTFTEDLAAWGVEELVASGNAQLHFETSQHLQLLEMGGGASAIATANGSTVLHVDSLDIAQDAWLDLADNVLAMPATDVNRQQLATALSALIRSAYNGGDWCGPGLTSSVAADDDQALTTLAVISSSDATGELPAEAGSPGLLLVHHAMYGDSNSDQAINGADYFRIDQGFLAGSPAYATGDFDHSGAIDGDDYFLIDRSFLMQTAVLAAHTPAPAAAVPGTSDPLLARPQAIQPPADDADILIGTAIPVGPAALASPFADALKIERDTAVWDTPADLLG